MPIQASSIQWVLETDHTAYVFGLNQAGLLTHRYWGPRLPRITDYPRPADPVFWGLMARPISLHMNIQFTVA